MTSSLQEVLMTWIGFTKGWQSTLSLYLEFMDLHILPCTFLAWEKDLSMLTGSTGLEKSFITCGTHFLELSKSLFGRLYSCTVMLLNDCLTSATKKHFQVTGTSQSFAFHFSGCLSLEKTISTLLIGISNFNLIQQFSCIHQFFDRFIHIKAMYKYIHAVHHRNTDIEPFAGLSMHPVEHVYYYSCIGPSLVLLASPFAFMFNALHLVISPAPGHCGWEDFMQSGQFHYIHHRFEHSETKVNITL